MAAQNDPSLPVITNQYFYGGNTIDLKLGIPNSFYSSVALDFRSIPSQMSVLPGGTTLSSQLNGLITAMDQDLNGIRWGVDTNGYIYRINATDVISQQFQMGSGGASGILYNAITDSLYIPDQKSVSIYGPLTSSVASPVWRPSQFAHSASQAAGTVLLYDETDGIYDGSARNNAQGITVGITSSTQVTTNTTLSMTVPTTLAENTTDLCFFNPDIEPFYSINPYIVAKGTGNWTLTLHDALNNTLASVTVTNANLTNNSYNQFKFASQIRAMVNASQLGKSASYHFHLTSTVADGTVGVLNAGDMTSADFLLFAYALVQTNNTLHPTCLFTGNNVPYLCIGNGNYLATYNFGNDSNPSNAQFVRHNLFFKPGEEVCGVSSNNQYLVIACERRVKTGNRNFQYGCLYFWDGSTNAPNFKIDIPMGAPYGLYSTNNVTYFTCSGSLYAWSGGQTVIKVRKMAYESTDYLNTVDNTFLYPNMLTNRYNLLCIGYPSTTSNPNTNYGVWTWGTVELTYPNSYGLSYQLANGQTNYSSANALQMGCVYNFVDTMYISWSYIDANSVQHYGLDRINNFSQPAQYFSYTSLIWDGGVTYKQKRGARIKIKTLPLPLGATLQLWYSVDRASPVYSNSMVQGDRAAVFECTLRGEEFQWGFIGTCGTNTTVPPTILDISMQIDPLEGEEDLRADEVNSLTGTTTP